VRSHFNQFQNFYLSFENEVSAETGDRFFILGDNDTDKTIILQVIALSLASAAKDVSVIELTK
jgi:ABC-type Na+ transport system ATPase subunit NatA